MPQSFYPPFMSHILSAGQEGGLHIEYGRATFTGTATSESLKTSMTQIRGVFLTPAQSPASDERLFWDEASSGSGVFTVTGSTFTVKRSATSPTANLAFHYLVLGVK